MCLGVSTTADGRARERRGFFGGPGRVSASVLGEAPLTLEI